MKPKSARRTKKERLEFSYKMSETESMIIEQELKLAYIDAVNDFKRRLVRKGAINA